MKSGKIFLMRIRSGTEILRGPANWEGPVFLVYAKLHQFLLILRQPKL